MEFDVGDEWDRISNFIIFNRDRVEEVVEDDDATKPATIIFIISIIITAISTIATSYVDYLYQLSTYGTLASIIQPPTVLSIAMNTITQALLPVLGWIFTFYVGNWFKAEADDKEMVLRAFGYSRFVVIIGQACSFLTLIYSIYFVGMLLEALFSLWAVILLVYSVMIAQKKGALIAICSLIVAGILAYICVFILTFIR